MLYRYFDHTNFDRVPTADMKVVCLLWYLVWLLNL